MRRALLPWLFPVAVLVALLVAMSGSRLVAGLVLVAVVGVALRLLSSRFRSGDVPRMFRADGARDRELPRWMRFDPPDRDSGES